MDRSDRDRGGWQSGQVRQGQGRVAEWTGQTGTGEGGRVDRSERDRGGGHGGGE